MTGTVYTAIAAHLIETARTGRPHDPSIPGIVAALAAEGITATGEQVAAVRTAMHRGFFNDAADLGAKAEQHAADHAATAPEMDPAALAAMADQPGPARITGGHQ